MKEIIFAFCLILFGSMTVLSQETGGKVLYKIKIYPAQKKPITAKLLFNDTISKFIYNKVGYDKIQRGKSLSVNHDDEGDINAISMSSSGITKKGNWVYRDIKSKKIVFRQSFLLYDPFLVRDNWTSINWRIIEKYKYILGYKTQKAIGSFRGRKYIAWFTSEISYPFGPGKLFGLPGVILEAHDTSNSVIFKAFGVFYPLSLESKKLDIPEASNYIPIKHFVFFKDHMSEMVAIKLNRMTGRSSKGNSFVRNDSRSTKRSIKKHRQKCMEIIYGWEEYPGDTPNPYPKKLKKLMEMVNETTLPLQGKSIKK